MKKRNETHKPQIRKAGYTVCLCTAALLAVLPTGCGNQRPYASEESPSEHRETDNQSIVSDTPPAADLVPGGIRQTYIGLEQAETAALAHAGLETSEVTFTKGKLEHDDGVAEYKVEFTTSTKKYEYEIDALDGSVLGYSQETVTSKNGNTQATGNTQTAESTQPAGSAQAEHTQDPGHAHSSTPGAISVDAAKSAALNHAGLEASGVTFLKSSLDYDDGIAAYEIEFVTSTTKYEYEIKAQDGSILESSQETILRTPGGAQTTAQGVISAEDAKAAALNYAGLDVSQVVFTDVELDYDDGFAEYDVEFYAGGTEYSFTIDAVSGSVLEMEIDHD